MRNILPVVVLIALLWAMSVMLVDGVVAEADRQREFEPPPVYATAIPYTRPAAFRLATPTMEQMDHVHHLLTVQKVMR